MQNKKYKIQIKNTKYKIRASKLAFLYVNQKHLKHADIMRLQYAYAKRTILGDWMDPELR